MSRSLCCKREWMACWSVVVSVFILNCNYFVQPKVNIKLLWSGVLVHEVVVLEVVEEVAHFVLAAQRLLLRLLNRVVRVDVLRRRLKVQPAVKPLVLVLRVDEVQKVVF